MDKPRLRRTPASLALCLVALVVFTVLDLWTKTWALDALSRPPVSPPGPVCVAGDSGLVYFQRVQKPPIVLIENYLEFRYAENCGAAFGVLNHGPSWLRLALFAPAAIAATLGLLWMFYTRYGGRLFAISVPLIASGALGNLIDRFRLGFVVDFIRFHVRDTFVYPTFNVADCTITIGVALLLIEGFIAPRTSASGVAATAPAASAGAKTPR
jgi:signal peptidase II